MGSSCGVGGADGSAFHAGRNLLEVTVNAPRSVSRRVECVVDHAVDHCADVLAQSRDDRSAGEFVGLEMYLAAATDPHGRHPAEAAIGEVRLVHLPRHPCPGSAAFALRSVVLGGEVEGVVNLAVGLAGCDGDGSRHAVAGLTFEAGCFAAPVVGDEFHLLPPSSWNADEPIISYGGNFSVTGQPCGFAPHLESLGEGEE